MLHEDYVLREIRDGVAVLRNIETGREIERSIRVNLNNGAVRIELGAMPEADHAAAR